MNKKKGFIIYKCKNYNATTIPFLLSCKLLNQLKDIESLIEDGDRGGSLTKHTVVFPKTDLIYTGKDLNSIWILYRLKGEGL